MLRGSPPNRDLQPEIRLNSRYHPGVQGSSDPNPWLLQFGVISWHYLFTPEVSRFHDHRVIRITFRVQRVTVKVEAIVDDESLTFTIRVRIGIPVRAA